jgi:tetratricopeptide (TPR) repeat protein
MPHRLIGVVLIPLAFALTAPWPGALAQGSKSKDKKVDQVKEADAAYKRAQKAYEDEKYDEAIRIFGEVLKIDPTYAEAYVSRGMAWTEKSQPEKAIKDYNEAIKVDPKFVPAYFHRGIYWNNRKEFDKAIKDFSEALALDPKDDATLYNRGIAWAAKGEIDKAIKDYDASIRLDDAYAPAFVSRGQARAVKKNYAGAIEDYETAIRLDSKDGAGLNGKAWILATCPDKKYRDGKKAMDLATMACELTKFKEAEFLDTLSCACAEAGRFDDAVKWQKKALADPEFAKVAGAQAKLKLFEQKKPYRDDGK